MQYVREFWNVDGVDSIRAYVYKHTDVELTDSGLYDVLKEEKLIDKDLRVSKYRALRDAGLFSLCEKIVDDLSKADPLNSFTLLKNDATHILYTPGGFFLPHQDYLSLTSIFRVYVNNQPLLT